MAPADNSSTTRYPSFNRHRQSDSRRRHRHCWTFYGAAPPRQEAALQVLHLVSRSPLHLVKGAGLAGGACRAPNTASSGRTACLAASRRDILWRKSYLPAPKWPPVTSRLRGSAEERAKRGAKNARRKKVFFPGWSILSGFDRTCRHLAQNFWYFYHCW